MEFCNGSNGAAIDVLVLATTRVLLLVTVMGELVIVLMAGIVLAVVAVELQELLPTE